MKTPLVVMCLEVELVDWFVLISTYILREVDRHYHEEELCKNKLALEGSPLCLSIDHTCVGVMIGLKK